MPRLACPECLAPLTIAVVKRGKDGRCTNCRDDLARARRQREREKAEAAA